VPGPEPCWWDAELGLGMAGDALGGAGVEGAWRSGRELAQRVLARFGRADS
jgi:renalase